MKKWLLFLAMVGMVGCRTHKVFYALCVDSKTPIICTGRNGQKFTGCSYLPIEVQAGDDLVVVVKGRN